MRLVFATSFLFACRPTPTLRPVYDCTVLTVEQQETFTQRIETCQDDACREALMREYCEQP